MTPLELKVLDSPNKSRQHFQHGQARTILMPDRWNPGGWSYKTQEDIERQRNFLRKVENLSGMYS